jgi:hypothetical protein
MTLFMSGMHKSAAVDVLPQIDADSSVGKSDCNYVRRSHIHRLALRFLCVNRRWFDEQVDRTPDDANGSMLRCDAAGI